ncbi:unnamed protein product [Withania somnifera]
MVKPSTPISNHLRCLKLSLFDQVAPHIFVPILFHYLPNSECNMEGITDQRCDELQKSLAQTLTKFYPLAVRLSEDKLSSHCNDEGVESKVHANLAEFLHGGFKIELLNGFVPADLPSIIGINISHIPADGFTLGSLVKEWAHISQTGTTKGCLPSFGHLPTSISPPSNIGPNIVTKRFVFDALAIAKLKDRITSSATFTRPTQLVIVLSFIWKVLVGNSSTKHGHSRGSSLMFPIILRGKSYLPSLEHALGNLYVTVVASVEAKHLRKELHDFVHVVGSTTRDTSACIGKASIDDITSMFVCCGTEVVNKLCQVDEMDIYPCTSWCRFPWYEADFGWGKPFWVRSVSKPFGVIILNDTKDGDGIEAWVSLKENDMVEFERDPLHFKSSI